MKLIKRLKAVDLLSYRVRPFGCNYYDVLGDTILYAILGEDNETDTPTETKSSKYDTIGEYKAKEYKERPHEYKEE
ncbi:MAG: hypothetical protein U0L55_04425 [Acutalibacteraceae bacterium]|nr:hypothetical protein [Acutalibacteraceae bacterium]